MSLHRSLAAGALAAVLMIAGCSDDPAADPAPVTAGPTTTAGETTTTVDASTTTGADLTTTTTSAAPPVTKPLTTAPPSELLTEVTAAYDAAYADLLAAGSIPDENYPGLGNHIAGPQLETVKEMLRRSSADGVRGVRNQAALPWSRVEGLDQAATNKVLLNVCRFDNTDAVDATGAVVDSAGRPFRYVETMEMIEGIWKWTGREWVDQSSSVSDCALPS